jgi:hypothetical protein
MQSIVRITAALVILGLCSAESSATAATTSRSLVSPLVDGADTAVAPLKKARKKVPPPKSLNPIKINDIPSESVLGRKLLEKTRRAANNNAYGGYNSYNKNNGNYATYGYNANSNSNGNYYANQQYAQAQYSNNANNGGNQNYQASSSSGSSGSSAYSSSNWNQAGFEEWSLTQSQWLKDFSVKFEGCHKITEWNKEAQDVGDMRVKLKRLVRFKMCPTAYCNAASDTGCEDGYGEYVIDLETFLEAYVEAKAEYDEYMDAYAAEQYNNNQDGQNQQNGYQNGYYQYEQNEQNAAGLDIADYLTCQQLDINYQGDAQNGYYNGQQNQDDAEWDGSYYIGPTCSSQGGHINLGVFKDDECTIAADESNGANLYYTATGYELPFSKTNMIELDCVPCSELNLSNDDDANANNNNGENDYNYDSAVSEWCEDLYTVSGKCETSLPYGTTVNPNNQACNYVAGVKVLRQDGTILTTTRNAPRSVSTSNKAAAAFIGLFTAATALLTAYACYLKTKLDRASIALLE